jgi:serralysin
MLSQPRHGVSRYLDERFARGKPPYDGEPVRLGGGADDYADFNGRNKIYGGGGDDIISGREGDDKLKGGGGDDALYGGSGVDYLLGGVGDDELSGGDGRNFYLGGSGSDTLFVGSGRNERILYHDVSESAPGTERDTIYTFDERDGSVVDLRRIDASVLTPEDDAFTWVGDAAFSGAAGELRYDPTADGGLLQGDVDGDGSADFEVLFLNFVSLHLTLDDFKL